MANPTTSLGFSSSSPAPDNGYQNAKPRDTGTTPLDVISFEVPNTGGVATKTANYTAVAADCGKLLVFNSASAVTLTLPATPPFAQWLILVQNIGAGALTINRNSLTIDGGASNVTLEQNAGVDIFTDGTNYFTQRGAATSSPLTTKGDLYGHSTVDARVPVGTDGQALIADSTQTLGLKWADLANVGGVSVKTANYTAVSGDNGTLLVLNSGSSITLTLPSSPPSSKWRIAVQNIGAGVLTVSRNGLNIDGAAANLTLSQNSGVLIYTDGTNYFTERGSGGGTVTLQTNGVNNAVQSALNLKTGTVTPVTDASGGDTFYVGTVPQVRAQATVNFGGTSSPVVSFLAGAAAGDLVVICMAVGTGDINTIPSGWTKTGNFNAGSFAAGWVLSKILSSGDVSTGAVTVSLTASASGVYSIVNLIGGWTLRETDANTAAGFPTTATVTTSADVKAWDLGIYFGANGSNTGNGGLAPTVSPGVFQSKYDSVSGTGNIGAALYIATPNTAGATTVTYTYTPGPDTYQCAVIIAGTPPPTGLTLTTTGTSGSATLAGNVLNVPNYGGATGSFVRLAQVALASAAATITFSSIPNTYTSLVLVAITRSSGGSGDGDDIWMQVNGDTGNNYWREFLLAHGGTVTGGAQSGVSKAVIATANSSGAAAGLASTWSARLPYYAGTTFAKSAQAALALRASDNWTIDVAWHWNSTSAINQIVLGLVSGSNFAAGTTVTLYGEA